MIPQPVQIPKTNIENTILYINAPNETITLSKDGLLSPEELDIVLSPAEYETLLKRDLLRNIDIGEITTRGDLSCSNLFLDNPEISQQITEHFLECYIEEGRLFIRTKDGESIYMLNLFIEMMREMYPGYVLNMDDYEEFVTQNPQFHIEVPEGSNIEVINMPRGVGFPLDGVFIINNTEIPEYTEIPTFKIDVRDFIQIILRNIVQTEVPKEPIDWEQVWKKSLIWGIPSLLSAVILLLIWGRIKEANKDSIEKECEEQNERSKKSGWLSLALKRLLETITSRTSHRWDCHR